jgi:hypothetical protein
MKKVDMQTQNDSPKWWQLYLIFPSLIGLFVFDNRLNISTRGHETVQIGSLVLILSFVYIWIKANTDALSRLDQKRTRGGITGMLYQHGNRLPLEKDPYAGFKLRNCFSGNPSNDPDIVESGETRYSLHEDVEQLREKE